MSHGKLSYFSVTIWILVSLASLASCLEECEVQEDLLSDRNRAELASVVVSGKVRKLSPDAEHSTNTSPMFKGDLVIKRIFKGKGDVDLRATLSPGLFRQNQVVQVEGLGDPAICDNMIRENDTKIFLLVPDGDDALRLNSSILPLTLNNLNIVDHVVNDVPLVTEPPVVRSPCYLHFCAFGGTCREDELTNSATCKCEQQCSSVFAPVCGTSGSNSATYANLCWMQRETCRTDRLIKLKHQGTCGVSDPCEHEKCLYGAECLPSQDGKTARCQCPTECPSYGDSVGSKPVCGTDGKDYDNMCEMRRAACFDMKEIKVKYHGKCDPCKDHKCSEPSVCRVGPAPLRQPQCSCNIPCLEEEDVVCGSDGKSYSNKCKLEREACRLGKRDQLRMLYRGQCSPENNPCRDVVCGPGAECSTDRNGDTQCVCPPQCEPVLRQVCGNDSVTYDNECELKRQACLNKKYVSVESQKACGTDSICNMYICEYGGICVNSDNSEHNPICQCPQCSEEYQPVCGENGITYENECKLRQENCKRKEEVQISYQGACDGCGKIKCDFYAVCENVNGAHECVCPTYCVEVEAPVCGSDGNTYSNECDLRVESCRRKQFLTIASTGSCNQCYGVTCPYHAICENGECVCPIVCPSVYEPVCGTDDTTYGNECEMRRSSCHRSITIDLQKMGSCNDDEEPVIPDISGSGDGSGSDEFDDIDMTVSPTKMPRTECKYENCNSFGGQCVDVGGKRECLCTLTCQDKEKSPVCGSDGKVYSNDCEMQLQSCRNKNFIIAKDMDQCEDTEFDEVPCNGNSPLVNPRTGNDYDCNDGQELCPANSYCHMTSAFSKCCKDDKNLIAQCSDMEFGCCSDGKTPAKGPRQGGCPDSCNCNPIGSFSETCDPRTKQCTCKPGVGGKRCDRCNIGYWGLSKISQTGLVDSHGNAGCIPCNCNKFGSDRDDCNQMTGRCVCKAYITGMKCDQCQNGNVLGIEGCSGKMPETCEDMPCQYGAKCQLKDGRPSCDCDSVCDSDSVKLGVVCGSDGQNYGSECQMKLFSCRLQQHISKNNDGPCKGGPPSPEPTRAPVTRPSRKTTRHINGGKPNSGGDSNQNEEKPKCFPIDDVCLSDQNCCSNFSRCHNGLCKCRDGYVPASDNTDCYVNTDIPTQRPNNTLNACSGNPCSKPGTKSCLLDERMGFRCECLLGYSGPRCDMEDNFSVPSFSGHSYLVVLIKDEHQSSQKMTIEIEFKPLNKDGILLFASRHDDGSGDFVSLAVKNGFVEFRYDLGGGYAAIKSKYKIDLNRKHLIVAKRIYEKGSLKVNDDPEVTGSSPATHKSLDLSRELMLGNHKNGNQEIYKKIGTDVGFVGCIQELKIEENNDNYPFNFRYDDIDSDVYDGVDVGECGNNPCNTMPCQNGATCIASDSQIYHCQCRKGFSGFFCQNQDNPCGSNPCQYGGTCVFAPKTMKEGFYCECPSGRAGDRCERESLLPALVPQFTGDSFLTLKQEEKLSFDMAIEIWFQAFKPNGVMLLVTQKSGGGGDFICLSLENKKLVFTFYLGSGTARIESKKHIHLDKWHKVKISRHDREGEMLIDDVHKITGMAQGKSTMLNIDNRPIYLGGFNHIEDLPSQIRINSRFTGVIQRAIINGRSIDSLMSSSNLMSNVSTFDGPPCDVNPCMNGGICIPKLHLAGCRCPTEYIGTYCDKRLEQVDKDQPVKFDGLTYLNFPNEGSRTQKGQRSNKIQVTFRTTSDSGILLLQSGSKNVDGDFLSLLIINGFVQLSYNLGSNGNENLFSIVSKVNISDGDWHTAKIERQLRSGSLQIDDDQSVKATSDYGSTQLDTDGLLWLGGRADLPWGLPVMEGFEGCIQEVLVDDKQLHLIDGMNGHSSSIKFCS